VGLVVFFMGALSQVAWGADNVKLTKDGKKVYYSKMGTLAPEGVGWAALIKSIINPGVFKVTNAMARWF